MLRRSGVNLGNLPKIRRMGFRITEIQPTPNPNAMKFMLDKPISDGSVSFLNAEQAGADAVAKGLFGITGVTSVLYLCDFLTVNKSADASWPDIKKKVKQVLAKA
jgi:hypothetical protein